MSEPNNVPKILTPDEAAMQSRMKRAWQEIEKICEKYDVMIDASMVYGERAIKPEVRLVMRIR